MTKQKACKNCNLIYEGDKCPSCEGTDFSENFKGKIIIVKPEKSEAAKKLKIAGKGTYAIKTS